MYPSCTYSNFYCANCNLPFVVAALRQYLAAFLQLENDCFMQIVVQSLQFCPVIANRNKC